MTAGELWRRLVYLLQRNRMERELQEEMQIHRAMMGTPRDFGNESRLREESRDAWGWNWLDHLLQDLRCATRALRKSPGFTVTAALILSMGIGMNLAFFQTVNVTYLQPLPVRDPFTLVRFWRQSKTQTSSGVPYAAIQFVRQNNNVLSAVLVETSCDAAWEDDAAHRVKASCVSANWFEELGYGAARGRVFSEQVEEKVDSAPVVVVSHDFWQRRLGSGPDVVGRTVRLNGRPAEVIGIASAGFPGLDMRATEVWVPVNQIDYFLPGTGFKTAWNQNNADMYARLQPGVTMESARDGLRAALLALSQQRPQDYTPDDRLEPYSSAARFERPEDVSERWSIMALIGGLMITVLLVACSNISNLVLSRAMARIREISIRTSLGASRWRVMRQLMTESVLLASLGLAGGLILGSWAARVLGTLIELPAYVDLSPDWRTILAATGAALLALLAVGLAPAWKLCRQDLTLAMRDGGQQSAGHVERTRLRQFLVAAQVAGSCLLLVVAGAMARTMQRLILTDPGFRYENVAVLEPGLSRYGLKGAEARSYWSGVRQAVAALPETEAVSLVTQAPLSGSLNESSDKDAPGLKVTNLGVDRDFFQVMSIPILTGRSFSRQDDARHSVIISRRLALQMYGTTDVLGKGFPRSRPEQTVVGIAGDARLIKFLATNTAELYKPISPDEYPYLLLIARASKNPAKLLGPMRSAARAADQRVLAEARTMLSDFERRIRGPRLASSIAACTALLALFLACLGIYGVVSYGLNLRAKELGIRVALGADRPSLARLLLRQLMWPATVGAAIGLAAAFPVGKTLSNEPLYLAPFDATVNLSVVLIFGALGGLAALVPIARALRANAVQALRHE